MINYEGIEYNLDSVIQFQFHSLKKLLEALAKKQLSHNLTLYGPNKNISLFFDNERKDNEKIINKDEKKREENKKDIIKLDNPNKHYLEKINNNGLIEEFINSQKKLLEHKKIICELKYRIEALERDIPKEKGKNKDEIINNIENKIEEEIEEKKEEMIKDKDNNIDKIDINENIKQNENIIQNENIMQNENVIQNEIIIQDENINDKNIKENKEKELDNKIKEPVTTQNIESPKVETENKAIKIISSREENSLKSQINVFEESMIKVKEQVEKIQKELELNKKSFDLFNREISQNKTLIQQLNEQNNSEKMKGIKDNENNLVKLEKKLLEIIEQKLKLGKNSENILLKDFNAEKEKLKEENQNILSQIKNLVDKNNEIENKIKDLPNISSIKRIEEKIKVFEIEMEEYATKNEIKHICEELDKYEKELSKFKAFTLSQKEINEKYREDILKLKNQFDNVKKTFSNLNKIFENNSLTQLLANLNEVSKNMVDKDEYIKFKKDIKNKIADLQMDVNEHNRNLDEIMPAIQKILTMDDLNKLENSLTGLIEKQNVNANDKFADKKEIVKSIKSIESQVKIFMKNLDKEREKEKNESVILASKPVGGYKCASCETYIGELKDSYTYLPWNKYHGAERPYRLGSSFSRILQGLNLENTFNPFLHRHLLQSENNNKKFLVSNTNFPSIKKVRKILPIPHVPSEHDMIKNQTIDEPFIMDNSNNFTNNKRYPNLKSLWGNQILKTAGNETNYKIKLKNKDNSFKSPQSRIVAKTYKVSKKIVKSKISNISEDIENHFVMPNL